MPVSTTHSCVGGLIGMTVRLPSTLNLVVAAEQATTEVVVVWWWSHAYLWLVVLVGAIAIFNSLLVNPDLISHTSASPSTKGLAPDGSYQ